MLNIFQIGTQNNVSKEKILNRCITHWKFVLLFSIICWKINFLKTKKKTRLKLKKKELLWDSVN